MQPEWPGLGIFLPSKANIAQKPHPLWHEQRGRCQYKLLPHTTVPNFDAAEQQDLQLGYSEINNLQVVEPGFWLFLPEGGG